HQGGQRCEYGYNQSCSIEGGDREGIEAKATSLIADSDNQFANALSIPEPLSPRSRPTAPLSRRRCRATRRDASWQSDLVVLLSQSRLGSTRFLSRHRSRSHRLRAIGQAG